MIKYILWLQQTNLEGACHDDGRPPMETHWKPQLQVHQTRVYETNPQNLTQNFPSVHHKDSSLNIEGIPNGVAGNVAGLGSLNPHWLLFTFSFGRCQNYLGVQKYGTLPKKKYSPPCRASARIRMHTLFGESHNVFTAHLEHWIIEQSL